MSIDNLFSLHGRTALVTGASRGLGRSIAIGLRDAGARVILCGRDTSALQETRSQLAAPDFSRIETFDVKDDAVVTALASGLRASGWAPDILINNAGAIDRTPFDNIETANFESILQTNVTAAFVLAREFATDLRASEHGRIVNVSSILGIHGRTGAPAYIASKHALIGLTRALAAELGPSRVTVNALCPGYTKTEINIALQRNPEFDQRVREQTVLGRWGVPEDMVGPVIFLCSPSSSYVTGQLMIVDGGLTSGH